MKILVVEDQERLSGQLAGALADGGYAVDCARDGERADFLAETERYDAIVLDLGLPKVDGLTLLRKWRDAGNAVPVIATTNHKTIVEYRCWSPLCSSRVE